MRYKGFCLLLCLLLFGCKTIAIRYEPNATGEMVAIEKMELRGVGKNKADFKSHKIENDSGFKIPDFPIKDIEINK